jgi:hypothetical protein
MILSDLIDRMVAAGMSAGEAGSIAAEIYAAGVASASFRTTGAERTRRWREKQASQSDGKRHETSPRDAGTEASPNVTKRHKPSQCDANAVSYIEDNKIKNSKRQNSERASRGSRIDPDWSPSSAEEQFAIAEGLSASELKREAARFRDYWKGRAGAGGVKLDWSATWQNWIRTSAERLGRSPRSSSPSSENIPGFYAKFGSEEQDAWDAYGKTKTGKTFPRDKNGGWRHPTQWPPGYQPVEKTHHGTPVPILRAM